ncbi:PilT-like protein [Beggiatoa sp. PS]|nr:PilT-like protein [Beggiatoa sp. PS]
MSERFLLDTDICSFIIKGTHPFLDARLRELSPEQTLISAVTRAELRFGLAKRPEAIRLASLVERFLKTVITLPWDATVADNYGQVRARLEKAGTPIGEHDTMIAAHALATNLILVTNNVAHFRQVEGLRWVTWNKS